MFSTKYIALNVLIDVHLVCASHCVRMTDEVGQDEETACTLLKHMVMNIYEHVGVHDSKWPIMFITIISVHLGNTNSCVAGYTDAGEGFKICIPSWVALTDDGCFLVGGRYTIL